MDKYDVIIFYGPPFGGKTAYYYQTLKASHHRISATEIFEENPEIGLRQVILRVVSMLREGKKIVIDDENWTRAIRTSYVKTLSAKFPKCKFLCVKFNPEELILYWSIEWYLAEAAMQQGFSHRSFDLKKITRRLEHWYGIRSDGNLKLEEPRQEEIAIKDVKPKLVAQVEYKFEVPGLFIQWESVITRNMDSLHSGLVELIKCWLDVNPWGRIIFIFGDMSSKRDSANSDSAEDQSTDIYKPPLNGLCQNLTVPVYFFQAQAATSDRNFCCPPQPGTLAFLQRLHNLDLFHRHSLYLYGTHDQYKMSEKAGVRHVAAKTILSNPQMIVSSKYKVSVKPELKNISFKSGTGSPNSSPVIPLFDHAKDTTDGHVEELLPCKYLHGVCFKDLSVIERYQQLYRDTASHVSETGSRMVSHDPPETKMQEPASQASVKPIATSGTMGRSESSARAIPSWLMTTMQNTKPQKKVVHLIESSLDSTQEDEPLTKKKKKTAAQPSTIYCMNVLELLETAQFVLLKAGKSVPAPRTMSKTSPDAKTNNDAVKKPEESDEVDTSMPLPTTRTKDIKAMQRQSISERNTNLETDQSKEKKHKVSNPIPIKSEKPTETKKVNVPETITTIPETAGFQCAATAAESSQDKDNEQLKRDEEKGEVAIKKTSQAKAGPDLSFLDDIF